MTWPLIVLFGSVTVFVLGFWVGEDRAQKRKGRSIPPGPLPRYPSVRTTEGKMHKGGVGTVPTSPRPTQHPVGQRR